ncbi:helix-turn-helix domain-containing protein [Amycolatopsis rhabdoformis]|uniref:Helix-turn-helix domain-containing protein n=1 Tax=Amycolatopsis rhabdoformis TaxID=1448059 RepID=A0ABZ1IE96_9PSEU|nr:helix-turn-helix domain-containing protein [Amycolatopsis rhabdoformis]WSE32252.1 helix-turn-helix domain-containing protein [Amycolatopsis rhabdoformis]
MSRWAPDARERLEDAALELFSAQGYENTTVAQIAERAGLNRATFFRHFADKREILFGQEDELTILLSDAIRSAPAEADVPACLLAALHAADARMTADQRPRAVQRRRIADANLDVQERGLLKIARTTAAAAGALTDRGVDELTARLAAEMLILAFSVGLHEWIHAGDHADPFSAHAATALEAIRDRAGLLRDSTTAKT